MLGRILLIIVSPVSSIRFQNSSSSEQSANVSAIPSIGPWPQTFILGGQKCATTSLWKVLKTHPQLCTSQGNGVLGDGKSANKEVHFFEKPANYAKGVTWYLRHFGHDPKCMDGMYMDASPNYLHMPFASTNFYYVYPSHLRQAAQFVTVLREPVARDLSWYNHQIIGFGVKLEPYELYAKDALAKARPQTSLSEGPLLLHWGIYHQLLNNWLHYIARSQFFVVNFQTLIGEQEQTIKQILSFLRVDPELLRGATLPHANEHAHENKTEMEQVACATRAELSAFFEPHNTILYRMLHDSHIKGEAPPQEPEFPKFESIACATAASNRTA